MWIDHNISVSKKLTLGYNIVLKEDKKCDQIKIADQIKEMNVLQQKQKEECDNCKQSMT